MRITSIRANNRRKGFDITCGQRRLFYPYQELDLRPGPEAQVTKVWSDEEVAEEGFTYALASGEEDTIHIDRVLEYVHDPEFIRELTVHKLTIEALAAVDESPLSKRELIRRLGTSASQFYRLLDPANKSKSIGQLIALLAAAGREVEFVVRKRAS